MTKLMPLGDRILVQIKPLPEKVGSILLPRGHNESAREALVLSVGPEVRDVEEGQTVLVSVLAALAQVGEAALYAESSVLGTV